MSVVLNRHFAPVDSERQYTDVEAVDTESASCEWPKEKVEAGDRSLYAGLDSGSVGGAVACDETRRALWHLRKNRASRSGDQQQHGHSGKDLAD